MTSRVDSRGVAEYAALIDAAEDTIPPCRGDWRFRLERHEVDAADIAEMRRICRTCPIADLCDAYGRAGRPASGMWCGSYYPQRPTRRKERTA